MLFMKKRRDSVIILKNSKLNFRGEKMKAESARLGAEMLRIRREEIAMGN